MKNGVQSGYTMLEAMVYITISALLVVGVFKIMNNMIERYKISRMAMQVEEIHKAIVDRCAGFKTYGDCASKYGSNFSNGIIAILCNEKLAPRDMKCNSKYLNYKDFYVEFDTILETPGRKIQRGRNLVIRANRLSRKACRELAAHDFGNNQYFDLDSMIVDARIFKWPADKGNNEPQTVRTLPISIDDAVDACVENKSKNEISWIFG